MTTDLDSTIKPVIRLADPDRDAAACTNIYFPHVVGSVTSFENDPPDVAVMAERIRQSPLWLVAEEAGKVVGYAYAAAHRDCDAYAWACDVSVYVDSEARGKGVGSNLYGTLFQVLAEREFRMACAGIALPNDASIALHTRMGFQSVGTYERIGWKEGRWVDVHWMQRHLGTLEPPRVTPRLPRARGTFGDAEYKSTEGSNRR